ncbi:MAG: iron-containing alcohol dehydrogenase [Bryobacteraceae bacterium]
MVPFDFDARTRLVFGPGSLNRLGEIARGLGFTRTLVVSDPGLTAAGYVDRAVELLRAEGVLAEAFHDFDSNPDTAMVDAGRRIAESLRIDSLVGLGGGSSMDCAKGINFLLTNGGAMPDYWGWNKATKPLLPSIGVPTTSGTGSEAQSYAIISDAQTHVKMACGTPSAAFRTALLDPELAVSQPRAVRAITGYDAISHAIETFVTTKRNAMSECLSREAWRLLSQNFYRVLNHPADIESIGHMQLGAYFAGLAIENSMLGATHACANPLTANFGTTHGVAISALLSHVVKWNSAVAGARYRELASDLPRLLQDLARAADLPVYVGSLDVPGDMLPQLADEASQQWTGRFNPRPFDAKAALEIYEWAF